MLSDAGHEFRCRVTGTNDVGAGVPVDSEFIFLIALPLPGIQPLTPSTVLLVNSAEPNPLQHQYLCKPGRWDQSPIDHKIPGWTYAYSWARNGAAIDGVVTPAYTPDADSLGRDLTCSVAVRSPDGELSRTSTSAPVRVPLPTGSSAGSLTPVYRNNVLYPVTILALTDEYRDTATQIFRAQQVEALGDLAGSCLNVGSSAIRVAASHRTWRLSNVNGGVMTPMEACITLIKRPRSEIFYQPDGAVWNPPKAAVDGQSCTPNDTQFQRHLPDHLAADPAGGPGAQLAAHGR